MISGLFSVSEAQCLCCYFANFITFLARYSIYAIAQYYAIARPSVCLSVTRVDQSKTVEVRIMTLVSSWLISPRNSKGNIGSGPAGTPNKRGVGKIRNFQPISRRISETVQDRTKVTIND